MTHTSPLHIDPPRVRWKGSDSCCVPATRACQVQAPLPPAAPEVEHREPELAAGRIPSAALAGGVAAAGTARSGNTHARGEAVGVGRASAVAAGGASEAFNRSPSAPPTAPLPAAQAGLLAAAVSAATDGSGFGTRTGGVYGAAAHDVASVDMPPTAATSSSAGVQAPRDPVRWLLVLVLHLVH